MAKQNDEKHMFRKDFPPLKNDRILKVARGEVPDKIPVWIMRQAGRYLPEFREIRKTNDFFKICQTPELACEVTLMPINRYDLDAAIIFSDILVIPQALGLAVDMEPGIGPVIQNPITVDTIQNLNVHGAIERLKYVGDAINLTRHKLNGKVPLFGFSGAPWTLMAYMIEGGGSKTLSKSKKWLYAHPNEAHTVLKLLADVIIDYLVLQVDAGAQILQVFDSSAEYLNKSLYEIFGLPYLKRICIEVKQKLKLQNLPEVPMVLFAKGAHFCLSDQKNLGYDVLSIDWTVTPKSARSILGASVVLQGNLDPCALYAPHDQLEKYSKEMVKEFGCMNYIANLGHGIYPDADPAAVTTFINAIHSVLLKT